MVVRLQVRHDTKQGWEYNNPILANGEVGVEIDNELIPNRMKIGNGNDKWNDLKFMDENLVHSVPTGTEAENIDGEKVFNDDITIKSNIHLPSDKTIEGMFSHAESDSEGNVISEFYQRTLSYVDNYVDESTDWNTCVNNGVYEVYASSFNEDLNTPLQYKDNIGTQGFLLVYADKDGNVMQVYKPALIASSTATVIPVYRIKEDATDTWTTWTSFNDSDTNIVHTFNNEEISGVKTFINKVVINNGVLELGNGVGASEIKKKNGETILTEDSNGLTLSTARNTIRLRPNGSNESNGEVVINNDGVINGKALKDSEGNVITSVYAKKADVIKTAKAHTLAESELLSSNEYPEYYQKILDKKKKSFDISKFTVVGNPTISDDGIYVNKNSGQYLQIPCDFLTDRFTLEMTLDVTHYSDSTAGISGGGYFLGNSDSSTNGLINTNWNGTGATDVRVYASGNNRVSVAVGNNKELGEFKLIYEYNDGSLTMTRISPSGIKDTNTVKTDYTGLSDNKYIRIGYFNGGSINLKQLLIMVDGEEVFNGHEERLDIIKANNYTIVGIPVISEDGVASGFSGSNGLSTKNFSDLSNADSWEIISPVFTYTSTDNTERYLLMNDNFICDLLNSGRTIKIVVKDNNNNDAFRLAGNFYSFENVENGQIKIKYTGLKYEVYCRTNYGEWTDITNQAVTNTSNKCKSTAKFYVGNGSITGSNYFIGSIDLNAFKIYVDGNLVYQPCLKIPYTYSKDGTKVVDIGYIERVEDCYNQFGTGNYFILDEYNNMFQMPLDTVDGYTRTLYNYRKGKTSYNYNTDLECNYSDACVSGTRYNFLKPFADSNYTLTVPTSSKDATGFTPTSTVDFMAKGRITLD